MFKSYGNHIVWAHSSVIEHVRKYSRLQRNQFLIDTFYKELKTPIISVSSLNIREARTSKFGKTHGSLNADG